MSLPRPMIYPCSHFPLMHPCWQMVEPMDPPPALVMSMPTEVAIRLVECGHDINSAASDWVRMPAIGLRAQLPHRLRNIPCTLLLRCRNATVWLLTSTDQLWSDERIEAAAAYLCVNGDRWDAPFLQGGLADAIEMPVQIKGISLAKPDGGFNPSALADCLMRAWLAHQSDAVGVDQARAHRSTLEALATQQLQECIPRFQRGLDQPILAMLRSLGVDDSHYNYLCGTAKRRNRLQFSEQLPVFLPSVSRPSPPGSLGATVREAIDSGKSWMSVLTKYLAVSQSAVNSLRGVSPEILDAHWISNLQQLLETLDAIAPEHRPITPEHWQLLTEQFKAINTVFGNRGAQRALTGARLREVMRQAVGQGHGAAALVSSEAFQIDQLRDSLNRALITHLIQAGESTLDVEVRSLISSRLNRYLAKLSWARLLNLSKKWRLAYAAAAQSQGDTIRFLGGNDYWNYVPGAAEFVARNGIAVQCLSTRLELIHHGRALDNCLAGSHLAFYHDACIEGRVMILALRDAKTRKPRSSAELAIRVPGKNGGIQLQLVQHTGPKNVVPTSDEQAALQSFLEEFATISWQEHAQRGLQALRQRRLLATKDQSSIDPVLAVVAGLALQQTLGQERMDKLLQKSDR